MMHGLLRLTWLEVKIFFREPLGAIGTVIVPVVVFVLLGRVGSRIDPERRVAVSSVLRDDVPVLAAVLIAINAVMSLVAIIAIYREGGILKRLRATPLRPQTILTAHVLVKLLLTSLTLGITLLAGKQYFLTGTDVPVMAFAIALLISTCTILSIGFIIASLVPTARFAQPVSAVILYPMFALSGLFLPLEAMRPGLRAVARLMPLTYSVSLLRGAWRGDAWSAHIGDIAALALAFLICTALSAKVFRWE